MLFKVKKQHENIIPLRRASNVMIVASRIKCEVSLIRLAIATARAEQNLSSDNLVALKSLAFTEEEFHLIRSSAGILKKEDLSPADRLFFEFSTVPRFASKIDVLVSKRELPDSIRSLIAKAELLSKAFEEVRTSEQVIIIITKRHILFYI